MSGEGESKVEINQDLQDAITKLEELLIELEETKEDARNLECEIEALEDEKDALEDEKNSLQLEYELLEEENENLRTIVNSKEYYAYVGKEYVDFMDWLKKNNIRLKRAIDDWYQVFTDKEADDRGYYDANPDDPPEEISSK